MNAQAVVTEVRAGALWARLNRPEALNSINRDLLDGLDRAMTEALDLPDARALIVTGTGRAFCAGADLAFVEEAGAEPDGSDRFLAEVGRVFRRLETLPMPTIAAINGFALAGGLELVLCCDLAVAAEDAKIGDAHANYGLLPGGGGSIRLPRRVGVALAKQLMFTGSFVPASDLAGSGLLNRIVPADEVEDAAEQLVAAVVTKSPLGLRRMKQLVDDGHEQSIEAGLRAELVAASLHRHSSDMVEGLAAFREKRDPRFTGH